MGRGRGTWDARTRDARTRGLRDVGLGNAGMWGRGTRERRGRRIWDAGLGDARKRWDSGTRGRGAYGTRRRDKQTTPDFFAEFVNYNFRCSRERY